MGVKASARIHPIIAGLGGLLFSALAAGAALTRSRSAAPPATVVPDAPGAPDSPRARSPEPARRLRPADRARAACLPLPGWACVVGRIEIPPRLRPHAPFDDIQLSVTAIGRDPRGGDDSDDDHRDDEPRAEPVAVAIDGDGDGAFHLQLAPGDYDLAAAAEQGEATFAGGRDGLRVQPGEVIEGLVLVMGPTVALDGRLRGMLGAPVTDGVVELRRAGRSAALDTTSPDGDGNFHFDRLRAGRYDLVVEGGAAHRGRRLADVSVPGSGMTIELQRKPILLGTIGLSADGSCPAAHLELIGADGGQPEPLAITDGCTFSSGPLPDQGPLRLVGKIGRKVGATPISTSVDVGAWGDPAPICLLGPCAGAPAALAVAALSSPAAGPPGELAMTGSAISYEILPVLTDDDEGREGGGIGAMGGAPVLSYFYDLPVGRAVHLTAERDGQRGETIVTLRPGVNEIAVRLSPP
jgi:hypothetical protein